MACSVYKVYTRERGTYQDINGIQEYFRDYINNNLQLIIDCVSTNTSLKVVKRDAYGNFAAGTITGNVTGNLTGNVTGNLTGDVTGVASKSSPAGMVAPFAMSTPPTGWLECNGSAISRTTYADLFAVIGTAWGTGDGSTTFNLPDLRGEFIRGWDNSRGVDSGRTFASSQDDDLESHNHSYTIPTDGGSFSNASYFDILLGTPNGAYYSHTTGNTGGTETRPRNIALLYCIKY